jgi:hypothetical protein
MRLKKRGHKGRTSMALKSVEVPVQIHRFLSLLQSSGSAHRFVMLSVQSGTSLSHESAPQSVRLES